ncbi:MAG: ferrous iron transport protein B [Deltaproteobacteria bacterium]|nr:ferrous iron transport protein B [Deltaproteobacteria bacterium]
MNSSQNTALAQTPDGAPATDSGSGERALSDRRQVVLVGSPNVGKSVLFGALTGRYVVVSNYPGTTVELSRGRYEEGDATIEVVDTPGLYSLRPLSDEERVARTLVFEATDAILVQVAEARGLERALPLTLQLRSLGRPMVLVLNMMDEAEAAGMKIDIDTLSDQLGIPVVGTVAVKGEGVMDLRAAIAGLRSAPQGVAASKPLPDTVTGFLSAYAELAPPTSELPAETLGLLLASGDPELCEAARGWGEGHAERLDALAAERHGPQQQPVGVALASALHEAAREIAAGTVVTPRRGEAASERLHRLLVNPWTGVPILLGVIYLGLYQFVGVFGAGTVVDFLESDVFGTYVNPHVDAFLLSVLPGESGAAYWVRELIGSDYGIITLGVTYAFAIVLPIVFLFFLFFSLLEDSGYFPRLAMLVDRLFKRIGLNGRAVIPIVLGFACDTMATMVTRVQETKRERIITTLLLALAIPCSAQYGVIVALLAVSGGAYFGMSWAFLVWAGVIFASFLATGVLASRAVPGRSASFYMELPPLRWPRPINVTAKVLARMKWYFFEILPIFVLASVLIWVGRLTGLFGVLTRALEPVVGFLGLPAETSEIFLYGFFRRDFGAAGLYDLAGEGLLSTGQLLVATVTLTLFLPCVAQLLVMYKERGPKATAIMVGIVFAVAFLVGGVLRVVLQAAGALA